MNILLVHGAFHNEKCWKKLIPALTQKGYDVHTLTLLGNDSQSISGYKITQHQQAKQVCELAEKLGGKTILVGHSVGGIVVTSAGEQRPELFEKIIYLTAIVPRKNERLIRTSRRDMTNSPTKFKLGIRALLHGYGTYDLAKVVNTFYNRCDSKTQAEVLDYISPQPLGPYIYKNRYTDERLGSVKKYFIECLDDNTLSIIDQKKMQKNMVFDGIKTLDSDHSPFASMPIELSHCIDSIIKY